MAARKSGSGRSSRAAAARSTAVLVPAHDYEPGDGDCACEDGSHVACAYPDCGAGESAYIHSEEARDADYERVVRISGEDGIVTAESAG